MNRLSEQLKVDVALGTQAVNNGNATGSYYDMSNYRKALVVLNGGAMAATKTTKLELLQAKDASGKDAKGIPSDAEQAASATITANVNVLAATIELAAAVATDTVEINGITFAMAAATDTAIREAKDAAGLAQCVNDSAKGVPGVKASASGTVVTLVVTQTGEKLLAVKGTNIAGSVVVATTQAFCVVELNADKMDTNNGFTHLAAKVTTTANTTVGAIILRGDARFSPRQYVGASAAL